MRKWLIPYDRDFAGVSMPSPSTSAARSGFRAMDVSSVRLIAWLSGSGAHKDGAETPRRRRHVLGVAAQAARCSNAMRAINSSPTGGHLVVARRFGLLVGFAGRLASPGVRRAGCFEASSAH